MTARWLARLILRFYPRRFRDRFGDEVLHAYRQEAEREGTPVRALLDLLLSLPAAHWKALRRRGLPGPSGHGPARDLQAAGRRVLRRPGIPAVVILTLGLGIGASTTIFSGVHAVLLRPLPFEDADRLVRIFGTDERGDAQPVSLADALDWRNQSTALTDVAMFDLEGIRLATDEGEEAVGSAAVSANLFRLLGVEAHRGRVFARGEDRGVQRVAVLAHHFWRGRFGADPALVGGQLILDGEAHTVVGVLPPEYEDPVAHPDYPVGVYTTFDLDPSSLNRAQHSFQALGRLAPEATLEQARSELDAIAARIRARFPEEKAGRGVRLVRLDRALVGDTRTALWLLQGAVGLLLLIACANVGSLLLARNVTRRREVGIQMALGAGRGPVVRQLLVESLLLGLGGSVLGLALAWAGHRALLASLVERVPRIAAAGLHLPVLGFALCVSLAAAALFGALPALHAARMDPARALEEGGRGRTGGRGVRRLMDGLALGQMVLTVVLLTGAALLVRSFGELLRVDAGFERERILTFRLGHSLGSEPERLYELHDRLVERLEGLGPVEAAGAVNFLPLSGNWACIPLTVENAPRPPGQDPCAEFRTVTPGYFEAMGIRVEEGRGLEASDRREEEAVVVVNRTMANLYWNRSSALGRRMKWGRPDQGGTWRTVVGVIEDVRHFGLAEEPRPEVYMTYRQGRDVSTVFAVRVAAGTDPSSLVSSVRTLAKEAHPSAEILRAATMEERVRVDVAEPRFRALSLGLFAGLALAISLVGVYGVLSYGAARRTAEMAIRIVLGARRRQVLGLILGRGVALAGLALLLGGLAGWWLSALLQAFLFRVPRSDPVTFGVVAALLLGTAGLASWIPARRAARISTRGALNAE